METGGNAPAEETRVTPAGQAPEEPTAADTQVTPASAPPPEGGMPPVEETVLTPATEPAAPPPGEETRVTPTAPPPGRCAHCGAELQPGQYLEYRGGRTCLPCVGRALDGTERGAGPQPWRPNPVIAVLLSLLPGLGQMYNRQLVKGALILAVFLLISIGDLLGSGGLQGVVLTVIYFWNLFDAGFTARRLQQGEQIADMAFEPLPGRKTNGAMQPAAPGPVARPQRDPDSPGWGILLIVIGVLFLLNNYDSEWLSLGRTWPVIVLGFGLWLIISAALSAGRRPEGKQEENHGGKR